MGKDNDFLKKFSNQSTKSAYDLVKDFCNVVTTDVKKKSARVSVPIRAKKFQIKRNKERSQKMEVGTDQAGEGGEVCESVNV